MRNLKKVLSLALALVMLVGMMVVGAGATSFADDASIQNQEAVSVLAGLGVVKGREDGSNFDPTGTLTRAEAAMMIAQLDLGVDAAAALTANGTNPFSDVAANNWAAGAIDYCVEQGYIRGDGNGHFFPNQNVTGVQFGIMLTSLLGYDAEAEGVTGAQWATKGAALARRAGLTNGVAAGTADMTRDGMAQMAFNALKADMVDYPNGTGTSINLPGGGSITTGAQAVSIKHAAGDNTYTGSGNATATTPVKLCEQRFPQLKLTTNGNDAFGRPASTWTYKNNDIISVASGATVTYTGAASETTITRDLRNYTYTANSVKIVTDGTAAGTGTADKDALITALAGVSGNGVTISIYANDNNVITDVAVINTYFGQVSRVSTANDETTVTVTRLAGPANSARSFVSSAFEKDDYVLYTVGEDGIETMSLAESVTGEITATSTGYLRLDGTRYNYTKNAAAEAGDHSVNAVALGEATIYLDADGNAIYVGEAEAAETQYLYVKGADKYFETVSINALFPDGTTQVVTVDGDTLIETDGDANTVLASGGTTPKKLSDSSVDKAGVASELEGDVYAYTVSDDTYKLVSEAKEVGTNTDKTLTKGSNVVLGGSMVANNSTVYVLTSNGTTYTGYRNMPTMSGASLICVDDDSNGVAELVFITAGTIAGEENAFWFFVADETNWARTSSSVYTHVAYVNGEEQEVKVNGTVHTAITGGGKGLYKAGTMNSSDVITSLGDAISGGGQDNLITLASMKADEATIAGDGALTINSNNYTYNDETVFVLVDGKTVSVGADNDITVDDDGATAGERMTYVYVSETDADNTQAAKVVYIIVDEVPAPASYTVADATAKDDTSGTSKIKVEVTTAQAGSVVGDTEVTYTIKLTATAGQAVTGRYVVDFGSNMGTLTVAAGTGADNVPGGWTAAKGTGANAQKVTINVTDSTVAGVYTVKATISGAVTPSIGDFTQTYKMNGATLDEATNGVGATVIPDVEYAAVGETVTYTVVVSGNAGAAGASDTITIGGLTNLTGANTLADGSPATATNCSVSGLVITIADDNIATSGTFTVSGTATANPITPTVTYGAV